MTGNSCYLERNMNLEKNVALYEEIFHALLGGWAFVRRPSLRGARMRFGVGHHGL